MDKCSDCRFCVDGYCIVYDKSVKSNNKACPEFEEK